MAKKEAALDGSKAVPPGGSQGLGLAVARALTQAGATAIVTGRDRSALDDHSNRVRRWPHAAPPGRVAQPEELGPLVVFLADHGCEFMAGQVVRIDGGTRRS